MSSSDIGTPLPEADWDAPEDFPDSGAPAPEPTDEPSPVVHGPALATTPARSGAINVVLVIVVVVALAAFLALLLRGG
jgi:hypothetical protein